MDELVNEAYEQHDNDLREHLEVFNHGGTATQIVVADRKSRVVC